MRRQGRRWFCHESTGAGSSPAPKGIASACSRITGLWVRLELPAPLSPLFPPSIARPNCRAAAVVIRARLGTRSQWRIATDGETFWVCGRDLAGLHYAIDKVLTLSLQRRRPDLLFLHAAVFVRGEQAVALLAPQGGGKSTTALAALQAGMACYSDELAPIDVEALRVWAYPRALVLKDRHPAMAVHIRLRATRLGQCWYVPLRSTSRIPNRDGRRLRSLVILERSHGGVTAAEPLAASRAAVYVYSHCLNPLAHPHGGLPVARRLVSSVPCYRLESSEPRHAVDFIGQLLTA